MFIYSTASLFFQVARAILEKPNDKTKVHLIYANVTYEDILLKVFCISISLLFIVMVALLKYSRTELHIDMVHLSPVDRLSYRSVCSGMHGGNYRTGAYFNWSSNNWQN